MLTPWQDNNADWHWFLSRRGEEYFISWVKLFIVVKSWENCSWVFLKLQFHMYLSTKRQNSSTYANSGQKIK